MEQKFPNTSSEQVTRYDTEKAATSEPTIDSVEAEIEQLLLRHETLALEYENADATSSRREEIDREIKVISLQIDELNRTFEMLLDPGVRVLREELAKKHGLFYIPPFKGDVSTAEDENGQYIVVRKDGRKFGPFATVVRNEGEGCSFVKLLPNNADHSFHALFPDGHMRRLGEDFYTFKGGIAAYRENENDLYTFINTDGKNIFDDLRVREIDIVNGADFFMVQIEADGTSRKTNTEGAYRLLTSRGLSSHSYVDVHNAPDFSKAFWVQISQHEVGYVDASGNPLFYQADFAERWGGMGALGKIVAKKNAQGEQEGEEWRVILGDLSMHPETFEDITSPRDGMMGVAKIYAGGKKEWYVMNAEGVMVGGPHTSRPAFFAGFARFSLAEGVGYEYCFRDGRKAGPFKSVPTSDVSGCCIHHEGNVISIVTPKGVCALPAQSIVDTVDAISDTFYQAEISDSDGRKKNLYASRDGFFGPVFQEFERYTAFGQGFILSFPIDAHARHTEWFLCEDTGVLLGPFEKVVDANEHELVVDVSSRTNSGIQRIVIDRDGKQRFIKEGSVPAKDSWHLGYVPVNGILNGEPYSYVDMEKK